MTNSRSLNLILSEIGSVMDGLIELGSKKTDVLVQRDIAGLERLIPAEQELVSRLDTLEKERSAAATAVGGPAGPEVLSIRESLRQKAKRIAEISERNRGLLRKGLEIVQYELKLFLPEGNYRGPGLREPLVFDHRV